MLKNLIIFFIIILNIQPTFSSSESNSSSLLIISCSLNPNSRSALLAKEVYNNLKSQNPSVDFLDLRDYKLPIANGHDQSAYDNPHAKEIHDRILKAQGIIIASPIYNYSVAASTKNLVELTSHAHRNILSGKAWHNKVVGFIGMSGSPRSLLAIFPFLNSLMMDSKVVIVPSFIVASKEDFNDKNQLSHEIQNSLRSLAQKFSSFTQSLNIIEK